MLAWVGWGFSDGLSPGQKTLKAPFFIKALKRKTTFYKKTILNKPLKRKKNKKTLVPVKVLKRKRKMQWATNNMSPYLLVFTFFYIT